MGMISKPLTALTKKDKQSGQPVPFEWNEQCEEAFQTIKQVQWNVSKAVTFGPEIFGLYREVAA